MVIEARHDPTFSGDVDGGVPRFFADATLGAAIRWLRIMGFTCFVCPNLKPDHLVFPVSLRPGDVVLTRQRALPPIMGRCFPACRCLLISANDRRTQLQQIIGDLGLKPPRNILNQCLRCGVTLQPALPSAIVVRVPAYIAETAEFFLQCPSCERIYWPGTHSRRMLAEIEMLFGRGEATDREHSSRTNDIEDDRHEP